MSDMPVKLWALELCNHMGCTRKDVSENDNYTKYYRGDLVRELKSQLADAKLEIAVLQDACERFQKIVKENNQ